MNYFIYTSHRIPTLLGATCCARLATSLRRVATCWVLKIELVRFPGRKIVARTWPSDYKIMQHPQIKCCMKNLTIFKFEPTMRIEDSAGGKTCCHWIKVYRNGTEIRQLFSLENALNLYENWFIVPETVSDCKKWKIWNILCLQASNFGPKMGRLRWHGKSFVVQRVSPAGRKIVVLFWTKCVFPCPIKPKILKLTYRRGQVNFSVFTFGS